MYLIPAVISVAFLFAEGNVNQDGIKDAASTVDGAEHFTTDQSSANSGSNAVVETASGRVVMQTRLMEKKTSQLWQVAKDAGVPEEALHLALDADHTKGALIEMVLNMEERRTALVAMKSSELWKLATDSGASPTSLETALDADDTKSALVEMILGTKGPIDLKGLTTWVPGMGRSQQEGIQVLCSNVCSGGRGTDITNIRFTGNCKCGASCIGYANCIGYWAGACKIAEQGLPC